MKTNLRLATAMGLSFVVLFMSQWIFTQENRITIPEGNVSVVIPAGWARGVPSEGYSLLLGIVEPDTRFRANMSLMITNIPGISQKSFTLDQLFTSIKANLDKSFASGYGNLNRSTKMILGKQALVLTYDIYREGADMTCKQYYIFLGDNRYLFTGVASQQNFPTYERDFDSVVESANTVQ